MSDMHSTRIEHMKTIEAIQWEYWRLSDEINPHLIHIKTFKESEFALHELLEKQMMYSSTRSIYQVYMEVIWFFMMALATHNVAEKLPEGGIKNYFLHRHLSYYAKHCIPQFFRFVEHLAFHFHNISLGTALKKKVSDTKISYKYMRNRNNLKNSDYADLTPEKIREALFLPFKNLSRYEYRRILLLRNLYTHRYDIGIDSMTSVFLKPSRVNKLSISFPRSFMRFGGPDGYQAYSRPLLYFKTLREPISILRDNTILTMKYLAKEELIKYNVG